MRIGIVGAAGRMGRMLVARVAATPGAELAGATEPPGAAALGRDAGELAGIGALGLVVGSDAQALFAASEVVIDFTTPAATLTHAVLAVRHQTALVVGTTGLEPAAEQTLADAARSVPVFRAANMSVGVTLLAALTQRVAAALGPDWDIEIIEAHHRMKVDAPSGTALALGRAAAAGRGVGLEEAAAWARHGQTGARPDGAIGFAVVRGGDIIGDHTVLFAGAAERIELTHKAGSREIFAAGAVRAALWLADRPPGLYGMRDLLGL